jgi:hypothetical protein
VPGQARAGSGVEDVPQPDAASLPSSGRPPLKLIGAATSAAPGAATLAAHRRESTRYPFSIVVSGAVLPPGHKSRSRCPFSVPLRSRMCCGCCGGSCCGAAVQKPCKIKTVAVLPFLQEDGVWTAEAGSPTQRHFLDTRGCGASGIAIALINSTHTRARGSWWLIEARWRALILRTLGNRWTSYSGSVSLITDRIHARL